MTLFIGVKNVSLILAIYTGLEFRFKIPNYYTNTNTSRPIADLNLDNKWKTNKILKFFAIVFNLYRNENLNSHKHLFR